MGEGVRKALAFVGCSFWLVSSLMPMFGGAAKHRVLCRGEEFPGQVDACFHDYIPVLELMAPVGALFLLFPFAAFASAAWAPPPGKRAQAWRLAPAAGAGAYHPAFPLLSLAGAGWTVWRAALYSIDPVTMPFLLFWALFALWFAASMVATWRAGRAPPLA
ncbi:hypothetical protein [Novosphingobium sp. BL-52-GroH]|uniref:hypothetical protein n=1 Tax=Novosphingobium sp. BL-52-GroH TaxID=3349877 RepID=UPI0038510106